MAILRGNTRHNGKKKKRHNGREREKHVGDKRENTVAQGEGMCAEEERRTTR